MRVTRRNLQTHRCCLVYLSDGTYIFPCARNLLSLLGGRDLFTLGMRAILGDTLMLTAMGRPVMGCIVK